MQLTTSKGDTLTYSGRSAEILERAINAKPWETGVHLDLMQALSFGGATGRYSLAAYSLAFDVENPKAHTDGGSVAEMVAEGRGGDLVTYLAGDIAATAALHARWSGAHPTSAGAREERM